MDKVKIEDIMETFDCDQNQAKEIKKIIKKLAIETIENDIEANEVPF